MDRVRIGNGCGFWGDNIDAPVRLAEAGGLDYLTLEYLAELTMSILAKLKRHDPEAGYATDFLDVLRRLTPTLKAQPKLKIVTNAGGMNPQACARKAREILDEAGLGDRIIGVVSGDDLMPVEGELKHLDTGESIDTVRDRLVSANAYLGAGGIVDALEQGASVVITGRVADASLTVGPAVYELGWAWDDWDRLCAGTVAGHLIECGAQVTGGLWTNWSPEINLADVGYPIAEIDADGTVRITKPEGTGGVINVETVSEQLLYEVGDPANYMTPDVVADFTSVRLRELDRDVVEVSGSRGKPAPDSYKVSAAYRDGFMASGMLVITGWDSVRKATHCGEIILDRCRRAGCTFDETRIECLGAEESIPGVRTGMPTHREIVLRVAARGSERATIERFAKEFAPLVTSGPPGVTGYATGRPTVREILAFWPALIPKSAVSANATMV